MEFENDIHINIYNILINIYISMKILPIKKK